MVAEGVPLTSNLNKSGASLNTNTTRTMLSKNAGHQ